MIGAMLPLTVPAPPELEWYFLSVQLVCLVLWVCLERDKL